MKNVIEKGEDIVIVVEGNIGAGKTTLGELLAETYQTKLYRELENQTEDDKNDTLHILEKFYNNKKQYAFLLQIHFLNERFRMIKEIFNNNGGVLDRSIYGDKIFVDVLHEEGAIDDFEYKTYTKLLSNMLEHAQKPKILIYLNASVDTCLSRIKRRDRNGETKITYDYLKNLENRYLDWYHKYDYSKKIMIDYNRYDILSSHIDRQYLLDIITKEINDGVYQ